VLLCLLRCLALQPQQKLFWLALTVLQQVWHLLNLSRRECIQLLELGAQVLDIIGDYQIKIPGPTHELSHLYALVHVMQSWCVHTSKRAAERARNNKIE